METTYDVLPYVLTYLISALETVAQSAAEMGAEVSVLHGPARSVGMELIC